MDRTCLRDMCYTGLSEIRGGVQNFTLFPVPSVCARNFFPKRFWDPKTFLGDRGFEPTTTGLRAVGPSRYTSETSYASIYLTLLRVR